MTCCNIQRPALKKHVPSFSKNSTLHDNNKISRLRTLQENFKQEVKPIIENSQEKLYQGKHKQSKGAKVCASIRWELEYEKYSKTAKYLEDKICKIKQIQKHFSNPEGIFKSAKNFLEKCNPKEDSSKATLS